MAFYVYHSEVLMEDILRKYYRLEVRAIKPLDGYISQNFKIDTDSATYVLKVYALENRIEEDVLGEIAMMEHLNNLQKGTIPKTIHNLAGECLTKTDHHIYRLQSYVGGTFLAETTHTPALAQSFGSFLAKIDGDLSSFANTAIESRRLAWNLANFNDIISLADLIQVPEDRKLVKHFIIQWQQQVWPKWPLLRKSIIHNDANDWNILLQDIGFGIIDFGDASYTALISELAIGATYLLMNKEDPISWLCHFVKDYHNTFPLEQIELDLLYYLIAARLVTSVCKSAEQKIAQPQNEYIQISEKGAWELIRKWIQINPIRVRNQLYAVCDFSVPTVLSTDHQIQKRHQHISKGVSISYQQPIQMSSAVFQYMFDQQGNRFLDAYNNIPHVGHQHPMVVAAAQRQIAQLNTNTRYLYDALSVYAERLLSKFPPHLNKVFFVNSGSAASDLAIRLAQNFTAKHKTIVLKHGYHGNTRLGIEISQYKYGGKGGRGPSDQIIEADLPNAYRSKFDGSNVGQQYAQELSNQIESMQDIAAFIAEPIVGCGGQVPLAEGYLKELYPILAQKGIVRISDEVQTGFGRMGSHFWGFEMHGAKPDIVILGKPIANGHPMGAVVTTSEIADAFDNGMEFFSSFGGNPVSCEIANAVLNVMDEEDLQQNALEVGNYKRQLLNELKKDFPELGDIRGSGLFLGIELIKDGHLSPHQELAQYLKNEMRMRHILVSTDGPFDSVIKSKPPMCFDRLNAEEFVENLHFLLKAFKKSSA
jgi:ethanolamine-phosphate phospho-lyase